MIASLFLQTTSTPVTVEGALILLLIALAVAAPKLLEGLGKILSAFSDRLTAGTNAQVLNLEVFRNLKDEVAQLRAERDADQQRLKEAEKVAEDASSQARQFQKDLDQMKLRLDKLAQDNKTQASVIDQQVAYILELFT